MEGVSKGWEGDHTTGDSSFFPSSPAGQCMVTSIVVFRYWWLGQFRSTSTEEPFWRAVIGAVSRLSMSYPFLIIASSRISLQGRGEVRYL